MVRLYTCRADAFADEGTQVFLGHGVARVVRPRSPIGVWIYQMMGGAHRTQIPAYATGGFRPEGKDHTEHCAKEMAEYVAEGFKAVKIKIGYGIESDIATIEAVREVIGPDIDLMIDANHGYDAIDATAIGNRAAPYNIEWFEEPVIPEALSSYQDIRRSQPIPVAGGETWHGRWAIAQALEAGAVDIIQPDVCGVGGLSEARKIITLADTHHVRLVPHVWGTAVALAAGLHYHAIIPPAPPSHEARSPHLEFDRTHNPFRQAIISKPIEHANGIVVVPDGPGLGIEIDRVSPIRPALTTSVASTTSPTSSLSTTMSSSTRITSPSIKPSG